MGEPGLAPDRVVLRLDSESSLKAAAAEIACRWLDSGADPLLVGLQGDLGSGKTTWVRGMLEGLGYRGRVPSPTYTLIEIYALERVTLVHVDLYRLGTSNEPAGSEELESLGLRDWLAKSATWLLVEWPERAPQLASGCDLIITFETGGAEQRTLRAQARSARGEAALSGLDGCS
jgi:tRNA threonylcarbamoyladenosine biosynthesis protein TsaE